MNLGFRKTLEVLNMKTNCIVLQEVVHTLALWCGGALTVVRPQFCLSCRQKVIFARKTGPVTGSFSKRNLKPLKEDGYTVSCLDIQHEKIIITF